ncbi:hypothetical protein BN2476_420111 [Paraburkholderia piptadeniae]|uniref:Uncharacterized protein n=1 Tax=Paraburkholderia piptadeniae TaxID=1701573 RepID=A0A1N7SBE1_9BURK|nr:hypothetical protein BN2476_420111 [Paraburkholderia piptadeniae]
MPLALPHVLEAGQAFIQDVGNEHRLTHCRMKDGDVESPWVKVKDWRYEPAFFCLLFFAAAKKSRCRPAQGQRPRREAQSRMPAAR